MIKRAASIFGRLCLVVIILAMIYMLTDMIISGTAADHAVENYSVPIYGIENNFFIQDQLSGRTRRDVEINRYNYTVKENGAYVVYHVDYDNAEIENTDGQEKITFYKAAYDEPFYAKYFSDPRENYKARFYLHKDTLQKLGISTD